MGTDFEKERKEAFDELAEQIKVFFQKYCHPHMSIIADAGSVELVEGVQVKNILDKD